MEYYVIGPDGSKYGPADVQTLKRWVVEHRIVPQTALEEFSTGKRINALQIEGLFDQLQAPPAAVVPGNMFENPPQPGYYTRPGAYLYGGSSELTSSFVWTAIGFLCCPIICPAIGLYYGNKAKMMGNPSAQGARIFAIVVLCLQGGMILLELIFFLFAISIRQPPPLGR